MWPAGERHRTAGPAVAERVIAHQPAHAAGPRIGHAAAASRRMLVTSAFVSLIVRGPTGRR